MILEAKAASVSQVHGLTAKPVGVDNASIIRQIGFKHVRMAIFESGINVQGPKRKKEPLKPGNNIRDKLLTQGGRETRTSDRASHKMHHT